MFGNDLQYDVFVKCVWWPESVIFSGWQAWGYGHITLLRIFAQSPVQDGLFLFCVGVISSGFQVKVHSGCVAHRDSDALGYEMKKSSPPYKVVSSLCSVFIDDLHLNCDITFSVGAESAAVSLNRGLMWLYHFLTVQSAHSGSIVNWKCFRCGPPSSRHTQTHFQYCFSGTFFIKTCLQVISDPHGNRDFAVFYYLELIWCGICSYRVWYNTLIKCIWHIRITAEAYYMEPTLFSQAT